MSLPVPNPQSVPNRHRLVFSRTRKPKTRLQFYTLELQRKLPPEFRTWVANFALSLRGQLPEYETLIILGRVFDILKTKEASFDRIRSEEVVSFDHASKERAIILNKRALLFNSIEENISSILSDFLILPALRFSRIMYFLTSLYGSQEEQTKSISASPFFSKLADSKKLPDFDSTEIIYAINALQTIKGEGKEEIKAKVISILSKSNLKHATEWILDYLHNNKKQFRNLMLRELKQFEIFTAGDNSEEDLKRTMVPSIVLEATIRKTKAVIPEMKKLEEKYHDSEEYENYQEQLCRLNEIHRRLSHANKVGVDPFTNLTKMNKRFFLHIVDTVDSIISEFNLNQG